jgi:hypothetical protein
VLRVRSADAPLGLVTISNAMHVHASFSEMQGSWEGQLAEAARCGVDVVWPTDHDWRMSAATYISRLHFVTGDVSNGTKVTYSFSTTGSAAAQQSRLVSTPTPPDDPTGGALLAAVTSTGPAIAARRCLIGPGHQICSNIAGTTVSLSVLPQQVSRHSWMDVLFNLSYRPATSTRSAGIYQLNYRIGTAAASRAVNPTNPRLGIITVPVPVGDWSTVTLDPTSDVAALWPDVADPRDNAFTGVWFGAASRNKAPASGYVGNVRFDRSAIAGDVPLETQHEILQAAALRTPTVTVMPALEVSFTSPHTNWFGGRISLPQYPGFGTGNYAAASMATIHANGGLGSFNHPFGVSKVVTTQAGQDSHRRTVAGKLLTAGAYGADLLEAGYHQRGGASLETHLALWDTMSRNGIWLTGNGVSDNHVGTFLSWTADKAHNVFATFVWAADASQTELLAGLAAGRAFCGELGVWGGDIWIDVDGAPMGSVSVATTTRTRSLNLVAAGLGPHQVIEVVRGPVDFSGATDPGTAVVATLASGAASIPVDTTSDCFVRVNVLDQALGRRVAFSNPVWLLHAAAPVAVPAARATVM